MFQVKLVNDQNSNALVWVIKCPTDTRNTLNDEILLVCMFVKQAQIQLLFQSCYSCSCAARVAPLSWIISAAPTSDLYANTSWLLPYICTETEEVKTLISAEVSRGRRDQKVTGFKNKGRTKREERKRRTKGSEVRTCSEEINIRRSQKRSAYCLVKSTHELNN